MKIPIKLQKKDISDRFIEYFEFLLERKGINGKSGHLEKSDWSFTSCLSGNFIINKILSIPINVIIHIKPNGIIDYIDIKTNAKGKKAIWSAEIHKIQTQAFEAVLNKDSFKHFSRHYYVFSEGVFGGIGRPLDGEYYIQNNLRIAPGNTKVVTKYEAQVPPILIFDIENKGITKEQARSKSITEANNISALLSVILDIGIKNPTIGFIWGVDLDKDDKKPLLLWGTYIDSQKTPIKMPLKGVLAKQGKYYNVDRNVIEPQRVYNSFKETLKCPKDIYMFFDKVNKMAPPEKETLYNAARLFNLGQIQDQKNPSLNIAFKVAAIEVLSMSPDKKRGFKSVILKGLPKLDNTTLNKLYEIRSNLFHEGEVNWEKYGIYTNNSIHSFEMLKQFNEVTIYHRILRHAFIRWILDFKNRKE